MKRIKPKDVAKQFLATGLEPATRGMQGTRSQFTSFDFSCIPTKNLIPTCACGIGVMLPIRVGGITGTDFSAAKEILGCSMEYLRQFSRGFDGAEPLSVPDLQETEAYLDGVDSHLETLKAIGVLTEAND